MESTGEQGESLQARINRVRDCYDRGLFAQACRLASDLGDPLDWPSTEDQVLGGRLFTQTGDPSRGRQIVLRAWRRAPGNPEARHHILWQVQDRRGSFAALQRLRSWWLEEGEPVALRADQHAMAGGFLGQLRDFSRAHAFLDAALRLDPVQAWSYVTRARVFAREDRHEDALEASREGLAVQPYYWAAASEAASALVNLGKDDEALAILHDAVAHQESIAITVDLVMLQIELGDFHGAAASLARVREVAPNLSGAHWNWWHAKMADVAYFAGDRDKAAWHAEQVKGSEFLEEFARTLRSPEVASLRRVQLAMPFVRQHHVTCVPATLTALARFWGIPADHLEIADEICYDGTSNHSERAWAERSDCITREFRVTWDVARSLIERGVPFTLTTKHPGGGHLQAVIGYDELRRTLLIRDPTFRDKQEFSIRELLVTQASNGPRGHLLVPRASASLLDDLVLPDAELFDLHHELQMALEQHRRGDAETGLLAMNQCNPQHRLTLSARRALAAYDEMQTRGLSAITDLLALYPEDVNLQLSRISAQRGLARRNDLMRDLRSVCESKDSHPLVWIELARELCNDSRQHEEALRWLKRVARTMASAQAFHLGANIAWNRRQHAHALELYRIAACLDDKDEALAEAFFKAARNLNIVEEGLVFLRERMARLRKRSSMPAQTLFFALSSLERRAEARAVLADALRDHPDDGGIKLVAMREHLNGRDFAAAERLLAEARPYISRTAALGATAQIAERVGDARAALEDWMRVVEERPLDMRARQAVTRLTAQIEGRAVALASLADACARFPHHYPLKQLHVEWLRDEPGEVAEAEVRHLVEIDPDDGWTRRELAITLAGLGRGEEALEEARLALQLEPWVAASHGILGDMLKALGRHAEARAAFRDALHISVDYVHALRGWLEACDTLEQRHEAVHAIRAELAVQTTFGDAIESFPDLARAYLSEQDLLQFTREAHMARPDLWESWSALVLQLLACRLTDEALSIATAAAERFPHIPGAQADLARVHHARLNQSARIAHLRRACAMNPSWGWASRELADALLDQGEMSDALQTMERAVHHSALDGWNHFWLGIARWRNADRDGAINAARAAVLLDPGIDPAWSRLAEWSRAVGRSEVARDCARELTHQRPGEARSWRVLAETLTRLEEVEEKIRALRQASALAPRVTGNWHALASALAEVRRWDEALAACDPEVFAGNPPASLRMRRAVILRLRGDEKASTLMQQALQEDPSTVWAWKELADWQLQDKNFAAARFSAEMLARLQPHDHVPLGFLADIKLTQKDIVGAKADLVRALQLDPSYAFAAFTLFKLHSEARDWQEAEAVLDRVEPHHRAHSLARRWLMHVVRGQKSKAADTLAALFSCDDDQEPAFQFVLDNAHEHGWIACLEKSARSALAVPSLCNPNVGWVWVRLRLARRKWRNNPVLRRLPPNSEVAVRAFCEQMDGLGTIWQNTTHFAGFTRRCLVRSVNRLLRLCPWFLKSDQCWGKIGFAFLQLHSPRWAARWLADWRQRKAVEPWMLQNLIVAFHRLGRVSQARDVIAHVRSLPYRDEFSERSERYEALHRFHGGDSSMLRPVWSAALAEKLEGYDLLLHEFIGTLADFADNPPKRSFDRKTKDTLRKCWLTFRQDKTARLFFADGLKLARARTGSLAPFFWWTHLRISRVAGAAPFVTFLLVFSLVLLLLWMVIPISQPSHGMLVVFGFGASLFITRQLVNPS